MNATTVWLAAGWTMLHFLWVGGAVALVAATVRWMLRGASAEIRYAFALASLAMLALAPFAIAWWLARAPSWARFPTEGLDQPERLVISSAEKNPRASRSADELEDKRTQIDRASASRPVMSPITAGRTAPSRPQSPRLISWLDVLVTKLPYLWLVGSPLTFTWLALGLSGAERLRHRSVALKDDAEQIQLCRRLAEALGITRVVVVAVAVCDRIAAPVLVGIARPLILLPAAALSGWGPEQIEMVLLHDLAQVRRWDNLVNLLQRLVESVLFFQPAVWIVSDWVRQEREHCCDRIVVAHTGRAHAYAKTLLALAGEPMVPLVAVVTSLAPHRNHLVGRIRQILAIREDHPMKLSRNLILAAGVAVLAPAFWIAASAQSQPAQTAQTHAEPVKPKDEKASKPPVMVQGKSLSDWITALKNRDPTVRKQAVEVLGGVTKDQAGDQFSDIRARIVGVRSSDKDPRSGWPPRRSSINSSCLPLPR